MQKWITFLMTLCVGSASYVNATNGEVNFLAGYRQDNVRWETKTPSHDPRVKLNDRFKEIDIFQIGVNARSTLGCNFYARAEATWGWVLNGDFKQTGTVFAHGRDLFSGSSSDSFNFCRENKHRRTFDDQYVYDANIAIGYPFYFCDCTSVVAPVIGYAVDVQEFDVWGGGLRLNQSDCNDHFSSTSGCCKNTYFSRWYGPFVGVDFNYRPNHDCWNLYAAFEYHWGTFKAKGHNDNDDFRDRHADMSGWVVDLGADYDMCNCWTVGVYLKFTDFSADKHHRNWGGSSDDSSSGRGRSKFDAHWNSYAVNVTVGRQF